MFFKIGALNNFAIFTETHLCWSLFFKTLQVKLFTKKLQHRCKSSFFNKARLVVASEEPMEFSIYLKNRLLPNMFVSWLPQIMLLFCLHYWNSASWCFIAIFYKLPLCQLQTVHLVDSLKIGERHAESNTFLCSVVH